MIEFERRMGPYKISEIWFSDDIYDVDGVDAVQFRNSCFSGDKEGFLKEASTTLVLDLTKSIDDIWKGMTESCRNQINRTKKDNITVRFNEKYQEFYEMNQDFRKRRGLPPAFISPEEMRKNYFLTTYESNGTLMGGILSIKDNHRIRLLVSCSIRDLESGILPNTFGRANRLANWEMIKYAKEEGLVEFDFGGYATGELGEQLKGINKFKLSFGGTICDKFSYSKSYSKSFNASKFLYLGAISTKDKIKALMRRRKEMSKPEKKEESAIK
jgi:lipid II:glycine glycyltransferase (peptidoglycan interpeptide bridge formation enzyme)